MQCGTHRGLNLQPLYALATCEYQRWEGCNQNQNVYASYFVPLWLEPFYSGLCFRNCIMLNPKFLTLNMTVFHYPSLKEIVIPNVACFCGGESYKKSSKLRTDLCCWYCNIPRKLNTTMVSETKLNSISFSYFVGTCKNGDFPNGWAPLQHMIVEGLLNSGLEEAKSMAEDTAVRWIRTNYVAFQKTATMHEKYDVRMTGATGGGDWIWLVKLSCIGILGGVWMAIRQKGRL
ncbi:unnamed protein product [Malus baccata var. baccata]